MLPTRRADAGGLDRQRHPIEPGHLAVFSRTHTKQSLKVGGGPRKRVDPITPTRARDEPAKWNSSRPLLELFLPEFHFAGLGLVPPRAGRRLAGLWSGEGVLDVGPAEHRVRAGHVRGQCVGDRRATFHPEPGPDGTLGDRAGGRAAAR